VYAVLGLAACAAVTLIVLLVAAFTATQFGPGGVLSDVRPGSPAPDFEVPTLDGGELRLSDHRGRPVVLNFWATWCPPCVLELPLLIEAESRYADEGLVVIAMNAGQTPEHIDWFLDQQGIDMPVAIDPGRDVYELYGVVGLPTTIWIDRDGNVNAVELGVLTTDLIDEYVSELVEQTR
jgi:peroxiredoxin